MQMRAGGAPGGADPADRLAGFYRLPFIDLDRGEMAVAGRKPVAVVDLDQEPVTALIARGRDPARGRTPPHVAGLALQVDAGMEGKLFDERIEPRAETA